MKSVLTWTERRLLRLFRKLSSRQNFHLKAEMFSFYSKYFVYRELKRAPQKLSFCFKCPDTGTVRILGNILYFTESEKDNLRTESCSYKEQTVTFTVLWKTNYVMENEKNSDYYSLSNRKMILSKLAGLLFPRKFNKRTSLFILMRYNSNLILWLKTKIKLVLQR